MLRNLALAYEKSGDDSQALAAWSRLLNMSEDNHLDPILAQAHLGIAGLDEKSGEIQLAIEHYDRAAILFRDIKDTRSQLVALLGLRGLFHQTQNSVRLMQILEETVALADKFNDLLLMISALSDQASILLGAGKQNDAGKILEKAIAVFRRIQPENEHDKIELMKLGFVLTSLATKAGIYDYGLSTLIRAVSIAIELGDKELAQMGLQTLNQAFDGFDKQSSEMRLVRSGSAAVYYELSSQSAQLRTALDDLQSLCDALKDSPRQIEGLLRLLDTVHGTQSTAEGLILFNLAITYATRNNDFVKEDEYDGKALRILETKQDAVAKELFARAKCLSASIAASFSDMPRFFSLADTCIVMASQLGLQNVKVDAQKNLFSALLRDNNPNQAELLLVELEKAVDIPSKAQLRFDLAKSYWLQGQSNKSAMLFDQAVAEAKASKDISTLAGLLKQAGEFFIQFAASRKDALGYLRDSLKLFIQSKDVKEQVSVWRTIALAYSYSGDYRQAIRASQHALDLSRGFGLDSEVYASSQVTLADAYLTKRDFVKSIKAYETAARINHKLNMSSVESLLLGKIARLLSATGQSEKALVYATRSLSSAKQSGNKSIERNAYEALARVFQLRGDFRQSIENLQCALTLAKQANEHDVQGGILAALAGLFAKVGDFESAKLYSQQSRDLIFADKSGQTDLSNLLDLGQLLIGDEWSTSDLERYETIIAKLRSELALTGEDLQFLNYFSVRLYVAQGRYHEAISIGRNLVMANPDFAADLLLRLAQAYTKTNQFKNAANAIRRAKQVISGEADEALQVRLHYQTGALLYAQGRFSQATAELEQAVKLVESVWALSDPTLRLSVSSSYDFVYVKLIETYFALYERRIGSERNRIAQKALHVAEENKARQFSESMAGVFLDRGTADVPAEIVRIERDLTSRRNGLLSRTEFAFRGTQTMPSESIPRVQSVTLEVVNREFERFLDDLRKKYPSYAALKYPQPVDLNTLRLEPNEGVLEYKTSEEAQFVWAIENVNGRTEVTAFYRLPRSAPELKNLIAKFRQAFEAIAPSDYDPSTSEDLYRALLFPLDDRIEHWTRIIIVPDGELYLMPFEAILCNHSGQDLPVSYFPSASALTLSRLASKHTPPEKLLFAIADPVTDPDDERQVFEKGKATTESAMSEDVETHQIVGELKARGMTFERLPGTRQEVTGIAEALAFLSGDTEIRMGFEATKKTLLATDLSRFRFIHFATHGILAREVPSVGEPALLLSISGKDTSISFQ